MMDLKSTRGSSPSANIPNSLANALAYKFGYGSDLEAFKKEGKKFSLLEDGTLDKPCTRLFLVNVS